MCLSVCPGVCVHMHNFAHLCESKKLTLGIFLSYSVPIFFLRQCPFLYLELIDMTRLVTHKLWRFACLCPQCLSYRRVLSHQALYVGARELNSLFTSVQHLAEPSPHPLIAGLFFNIYEFNNANFTLNSFSYTTLLFFIF